MLESLFSTEALIALGQVIMIDLVLAGDNAIVIGMAAAGLPKEQRGKAILIGIIAATVLRIIFALATTWLIALGAIVLVVGGLLLFWVCWKMWSELRSGGAHNDGTETVTNEDLDRDGDVGDGAPKKTFAQAAWQIVIADVSMSLDNVLAVAASAKDHPNVLIFGLVLSIALMGFAASFVAKLLNKHRWIAYVGLAVIVYVAIQMTWEGLHMFRPDLMPAPFSIGALFGLGH